MPTAYRSATSPFAALEDAFAVLTAAPRPLALDGTGVPGLPDGPIPLSELWARLLHPSTPYATRDAAMAALLTRAKNEGGAATVGLARVLLPSLRRAATTLARTCPERAADIEADLLVGLIAAIAATPTDRPRLAGVITGRAYDAAKSRVRSELAERGRVVHAPVAAPPRPPFGHPDLVLAEAALAGAITADDAALIGATRLGELTLKQAARVRGVSYTSIRAQRSRAERALVQYLRDGDMSGVATDAAHRTSCHPATARPVTHRAVTARAVTERVALAGSPGVEGARQGRRSGQKPELCPDLDKPSTPRR